MNKRNDERKLEIYNFIRSFISEQGKSPTTLEICEAMAIGKATASKYVTRLIEEGVLEKNGRYGLKCISSAGRTKRLPIIGTIACGKPRLAVEDIEGYISVDDEYLGDGEYFALTASGSSMKDVGIDEGDIVYIKRQMTAENGDIVAAIISDEITGESIATLKRFYKDEAHKRFILHPENREMSDIIVKDVSIVGIAVRVLKNLRNK